VNKNQSGGEEGARVAMTVVRRNDYRVGNWVERLTVETLRAVFLWGMRVTI
jgi:hypothetical protein